MQLEDYEKEQARKKYFIIALIVLFSLVIVMGIRHWIKTSETTALQERKTRALEQLKRGALENCQSAMLGVNYLCQSNWEKMETKDRAVVYRVKKTPEVWFKIVKFDIDFILIEQLSKDRLEAIGQYAEGFAVEDAEVNGFKAIKIKAFSNKNPQIRLLDYYFVREQTLYALMFSVNPKSQWDHYKFVFQSIVDSFGFPGDKSMD